MKMPEFVTTASAAIMAIMSIIMVSTIVQNGKALDLSRKSIEQSQKQLTANLMPNLEMTIADDGNMTMLLKNSGSPDISDLKLYPIVHLVDVGHNISRRKILQGPSFTCPLIKSGETIEVPVAKYFDTNHVEAVEVTSESFKRILTIVITYRRQVDQHPFILIEPFYPLIKDGKIGIGFLHQYDGTALNGQTYFEEEYIKEIRSVEKLLFRMDDQH